jgi:hypothetical protein
MSTVVRGFVPPDDKWQRMKAIWDNCEAVGVEIPDEVLDFFDHVDPDPAGVEVKIPTTKWSNNHAEGLEIEVDKIPKHVKMIRFYNSW